MNREDVFVRQVELPLTVKGFVTPNDDGTYSVYLNSLYDEETQRRTLEHELRHLDRNHFEREDASYETLEAEADGLLVQTDDSQRTIPLYRSLEDLRRYLEKRGVLEKAIE